MVPIYFAALLLLHVFPTVLAKEDVLEKAQRSGWHLAGAVEKTQHIDLTFWLKPTHTQDLKELVNSVSDPRSANYGHYLTKEYLDALTKPTAEHVTVVKKALEGQQIHIEDQGARISANVNVSFAEKLFGGRFETWCHERTPGDSRDVDKMCVIRNPTATIPAPIRDACDIITPLTDGFPPVHPMPGPIIRHRGGGSMPIAFAKIQQPLTAGCCFSYGFGAMMKPCCLEAHQVDDVATCKIGKRLGGATNFVKGKCPASAEEAAEIGKHRDSTMSRPAASASLESVASDTHAEFQQPSTSGCCFSYGLGAMMKPCCLKTHPVDNIATCNIENRLGGAANFVKGRCPASAEEAAEMKSKISSAITRPSASASLATGISSTNVESNKDSLSSAPTHGCCYSIGYGVKMEACCLKTKVVDRSSQCDADVGLIGGAMGFDETGCPTTAAEAHTWLTVRSADPDSINREAHEAFNLFRNLPLVGLAFVGGIVVVGLLLVARGRQDVRSTPFLDDHVAE